MEKQEYLDELKKKLEELKSIFANPRLFLQDYFNTLKGQIHELKIEDNENIFNKIKSLETSCLENIPVNKIDITTIYLNQKFDNIYNTEVRETIRSIEEEIKHFSQNEEGNGMRIQRLLEKLDRIIKKKLLDNKTLIVTGYFGENQKKFLLIINDEYFSKNSISSFNEDSLSFEGLKINYLQRHKLNKMEFSKVLDFNLEINDIHKIDLSYRNINSIENECFNYLNNLENLNLSANRLTNINENTFKFLSNLKELNLSLNEITMIASFKTMNNLIKLNLSKNVLESISKDYFVDLNYLTELDLANNKISLIEKSSFQDLKNLEKLNLSYNEISILNKDLFTELFKAKELRLNNNKIESIEIDSFKSMNNLITLDLAFNKLTQLEQGLLNDLNSLEILHLSNNRIDNIGQDLFKNVSQLKTLNLDNNQLHHIGSGLIKQLMGLRYFRSINVDRNPISLTEKTKISLEFLKKKHF